MAAHKDQGGTKNASVFRRQWRAGEYLPDGPVDGPTRGLKSRRPGRRHRALYGLATLTALAGAAVLPLGAAGAATAGAATASDSCIAQIQVPDVSITASSPGMFRWIQGTLVQSCNAADAKWDAQLSSQTNGSWDFHNTSTANWGLPYGLGRMLGSYQVVPAGAVDGAGNPIQQATTSFGVKLGSRVQMKAYRIGRVVYLHAQVSRFNWNRNGGYGAWQPSVNRDVKFYIWQGGGWVLEGSLATGADGWTRSFNILVPHRHAFYAHAMQTPIFWGGRSHNLSR
jgi:hypothetical protein